MITIDLRSSLTVSVPDAAGVDHSYDLVEGLNDVPPEVAEHWYVMKFMRPVRRVPRSVVPSAARPALLPPSVISTIAEALQPVAEPAVPVEEPPKAADAPKRPKD
jgi:hypothetical protein